ncbi:MULTISPECIES: pseudouridine synthase [Enterococcus]|uniref:pseudouridine synthase n=1 Tax=Enterococcus TaxID=1350 RepID=UPI00065E6CA2|nr:MULTISPECIES: pseudouridine synthase [Enterococcus]
MRLDKFLADMQIGSRKEVKKYIKGRLVRVNGQVVTSDKTQVTEEDQILFDGQPVIYQKYFYYLLHKPQGVVSATTDRRDPTVLSLLKEDAREDLFPVGRLDKDTEGLLLITNDGELAHRLLSPKKHVEKEYFAKIDGIMTKEDVAAFAQGVTIDGGEETMPAELTLLTQDETTQTSEIRLILHEGKFHQVKRMVKAVGKKVTYLKRLRMGSLVLEDSLKLGTYRPLTADEIAQLQVTNEEKSLRNNQTT